jgi:hypothetical protein
VQHASSQVLFEMYSPLTMCFKYRQFKCIDPNLNSYQACRYLKKEEAGLAQQRSPARRDVFLAMGNKGVLI